MKLLLPLLFLFIPQVSATPNLCQEIIPELIVAQEHGIITHKEAEELYLRCRIQQKLREKLTA